jgi:hypothetical protein
MNDKIVISMKRYKELIMAEEKLLALEAAGVNNWEGYSDAMEEEDEDEDN